MKNTVALRAKSANLAKPRSEGVSSRQAAESGVALVTTVIVVAMLAVVGVALMQSTTADRAASRSVANFARAQLAAQAGAGMAGSLLSSQMTNDHFIVAANTNGQLFVGNGSNQPAGTFAYTPIFSTVSNLSTAVSNVVSSAVPTLGVAGGVVFTIPTNQMPGGLSITSPPVSWVYMTNSSGQTDARFAFWVEDLSGKLDLSVVGVTNAAQTNSNGQLVGRRPSGTNPAEIALWSLFNPGASNDWANVAAVSLVEARSNILTRATARLVSSNVTTNLLADFAVNLRYDDESEVIPFGFGYADQGKPKYNLNTNLTADGVNSIATVISKNLPNFAAARAGAMKAGDYLTNIAANIVDYADSDSSPTAGAGDYPAWRGVEAIAWPNEVFMRFNVQSRTPKSGNYEFKLGIKQGIEVWNLSSKTITVSPTNYEIYNDLNIGLKCSNWVGNLSTVDPTQKPVWDVFTNKSTTLKPNEYAMLGVGTRVFTVNVPTNLVGTNPTPQLSISPAGSVLFGKYAVRIGTSVIDGASAGRHPGESTNMKVGDFHYIVTACGFGLARNGGLSLTTYNLAGGDPRAQLLFAEKTMGLAYKYSTPGSRNRDLLALGGANTVDPPVNWPDRGHSSAIDLGPSPTDATEQFMSDFTPLAGDTNYYLQKITDAGAYSNVLELGNIFDPISWGDTKNPFHQYDPAAWMFLTSAANVSTNGAGCGRNSLRIGRFEHPRFNTNGARAVQLLDLFAAGPADATVVTNRIAGKININTAGTNALRALAAGVANSSDSALQPGGINFFVPTNAVAAFVSGVTNARKKAPFFSPSQLAAISTNALAAQWPTNAVFGNFGPGVPNNTNYFGNSNLGKVTEWNDEGAEEWFAKVYPLAAVRSRNFMVYAVGQALQPGTTNVLSTSKGLYQIYIRPVRDGGTTTNSVAETVQTWSL